MATPTKSPETERGTTAAVKLPTRGDVDKKLDELGALESDLSARHTGLGEELGAVRVQMDAWFKLGEALTSVADMEAAENA